MVNASKLIFFKIRRIVQRWLVKPLSKNLLLAWKIFILAKLFSNGLLSLFSHSSNDRKKSTKRRFGRRHSRSWRTWKYRSKAQYILKQMWCYCICRIQWVLSERMSALLIFKNSKIQFAEQTLSNCTECSRPVLGSVIVKSFWTEMLLFW